VRDQGIGIPPEALQRIFGRFERAVSSRQYGGLGLGLFLSRQIVEAHGGSIHVESEAGAGATFVLELPVQPGQSLQQEPARPQPGA
jgi:signal transduction histidine kinase